MSIHPGQLGKYELQERLGQGGMAEVWKAFDAGLQRYVAIKFLHTTWQADPTFLTRFVREAQAVASLRHPNIVQIYDFETAAPGTENPLAYMVMDYIQGPTLADYLRITSHVRKFPSAAEMVSLFFSISEAVDYAHQRGLLHRDIKPANILLDRSHTARNSMGEPMLTDFGIAKILGGTDGTLTSTMMGTPLYISPEQALGRAVSVASDIYSLSVILYEMCTGSQPFRGETSFDILQQHFSAPPPSPERLNPAVSPALAAVILRGLAKDPAARFPSAMALTSALAEALGVSLPTSSRRPISSPDMRERPVASTELPDLPTHLPQPVDMKVDRPSSYSPATPPPVVDTQPECTPTLLDAHKTNAPYIPEHPPLAEQALTLPSPPARRLLSEARRRRGLFIALLACLIVALIGSGLAVFLHSRPGSSSPLVGNAFFSSSGASSGANNKGLNDTFQVHFTNIPQPATGKQYYAWLLPDLTQSEGNPRALGPLVVNSGVATLPASYKDPQYENLVAQFSRFLVTEEDVQPAPQSPALDTHLWRYYAEIPQNPPASNCARVINQLSVLCHLRHLLSGDPELAQVNLQGGLNYWFLNNVKELQKWAREAVDRGNSVAVRHKVVNVLYILDGRGCIAQDVHQAPSGLDNTPDDSTLANIAALPLLSCALSPDIPGYQEHIHNHLNAMIQSPGVLGNQVNLASKIGNEFNTINAWLKKVQSDARQLIAMDNTQLIQPAGQSLRNEMDTLATNLLSGGTNVETGTSEKGVVSISEQIQQLANMDVTLYTAQ